MFVTVGFTLLGTVGLNSSLKATLAAAFSKVRFF